jgi:hypothetical protein
MKNVCLDCGNVIKAEGVSLCTSCYDVKRPQYNKVILHLALYPNSSMWDIHKAAGVPMTIIGDYFMNQKSLRYNVKQLVGS